MSSNELAVGVRNVSKCYNIYDAPHQRLKQSIYSRLQRLTGKTPKTYFREFWALRDVSFEVRKGETIGILGRNGSGKSTLLQIIAGTIAPTSGTVETFGRVAALLELGAGFNPDFTGRENVYMNAGLLGLRRNEVDLLFDDIASFADIGNFLEQPVKTYSSGMFVRLAFAVIAHVKADVLLIDEALAVGDVFFQQKCIRFLRSFHDRGGAVLLVTHDTAAIATMCQSAVLLFSGGQRNPVRGDVESVLKRYLGEFYDDPERKEVVTLARRQAANSSSDTHKRVYCGDPQTENVFTISQFRRHADSFGESGARIVDVFFEDIQGQRAMTVQGGSLVKLVVRVEVDKHIPWPAVGFMLKDRLGQYLFAEGTDLPFRRHEMIFESGETVDVLFEFNMPILIQGKYTLNAAVAEGIGDLHIQHHWVHDAIELESLTSRLVHGIAGVQNLDIAIHVRKAEKASTQ